jgi:hypothetical protein
MYLYMDDVLFCRTSACCLKVQMLCTLSCGIQESTRNNGASEQVVQGAYIAAAVVRQHQCDDI